MESNIEPVEKLRVISEDIPNLVDAGMEIGFHDQLVESDREIVEHLVMESLGVVSGDLYVAEHLVVRNEMLSVEIFLCVDGDLNILVDMDFVSPSVDSLVVDEALPMKHYV